MKEFLTHFFGAGKEPEFSYYTLAHFIPLLLLAAVIFLLYRYREKLRGLRHESSIRYVLAFMMIICDMSYYWRLSAGPWLSEGPSQELPIAVCAWAVILGSFMLVGKSQKLFDIVYFWLLSGSLFALITPAPLIFVGPTRYRFYQYWLEHTLGYVAVFYMIFVHRMRPNRRSIVRSYCALAVLAALAAGVNALLPGANYLFMARPESAPSVLDILPPNYALRILVMMAAITAMFLLAYLPWYLMDRKKQKAAAGVSK